MSDHKAEMMELADDLADERYGKDFYDLPRDLQDSVYNEAMQQWHDKMADRAEYLSIRLNAPPGAALKHESYE